MRSKLFHALYALNIVVQALFNLATPAALLFFIAWLFVKKVGAPEWIYVIAIPLGLLIGLYTMVRFILSACAALDRLEKQSKKNGKDNKSKTDNKGNNK